MPYHTQGRSRRLVWREPKRRIRKRKYTRKRYRRTPKFVKAVYARTKANRLYQEIMNNPRYRNERIPKRSFYGY